ncbi:MAG: hypothetical protein WA954_07090 [Parerythrobacter sp.]
MSRDKRKRCDAFLAGYDTIHHFGAMNSLDTLTFASEAELAGLLGLAFLVLAIAAALAERRRAKRRSIDHVGWVPWFAISFASMICGAGLVTLAFKGIAAG